MFKNKNKNNHHYHYHYRYLMMVLSILIVLSGCQSIQPGIEEGEDIKIFNVDSNEITDVFNNKKNNSSGSETEAKLLGDIESAKGAVKKPVKKTSKKVFKKFNAKKRVAKKPRKKPTKKVVSRKPGTKESKSMLATKPVDESKNSGFEYRKENQFRKSILLKRRSENIVVNKSVYYTNDIVIPVLEEIIEEPELIIENSSQRKVENDLISKPLLDEGDEVIFNGLLLKVGVVYNFALTDYNNSISILSSAAALLTKVHEVGIEFRYTPFTDGENLFSSSMGYDLQVGLIYNFRLAISYFTFSLGAATGFNYFKIDISNNDITYSPSSFYIAPNFIIEAQILNFLSIGIPMGSSFYLGSSEGLSNNLNRLHIGLEFVWRFLKE